MTRRNGRTEGRSA